MIYALSVNIMDQLFTLGQFWQCSWFCEVVGLKYIYFDKIIMRLQCNTACNATHVIELSKERIIVTSVKRL